MRRISLQLAVALTATALLAGFWIGHGNAASLTSTPGSNQDPLVTKGYVDEAIQAVIARLENGGQPSEPGQPQPIPVGLSVVSVAAGGRLIAEEGSEFILRSGSATAIGSAAGGIPDLTAGRDLANNASIPANHLLLFPRSDQRGIKATTNIVVMVRGAYYIEP